MQIGTEYSNIYDFLVAKYGEENITDNGNEEYTLTIKGYDAIINGEGQLENFEKTKPNEGTYNVPIEWGNMDLQ